MSVGNIGSNDPTLALATYLSFKIKPPPSQKQKNIKPSFKKKAIIAQAVQNKIINRRDHISKIRVILKNIGIIQIRRKINVSSDVITTVAKEIGLNFKRINDVYVFLMSIFADYNHDVGSINTIRDKLQTESYTNTRYSPKSIENDILLIFCDWIAKIRWLDPNIRNQIIPLIGNTPDIDNILVEAFGKRARTIDENKFMAGLFKYMKNDSGNTPLPFGIVRSNEVSDARGSAGTHISFDQSSKSSAPATYAAFKKGYKIDVGLPMLADKGVTQTSNPLLYFTQRLRTCLNQTGEPQQDTLSKLAEDYVINNNPTFMVDFKLNGNSFLKYTYKFEANKIIVDFDTHNRQSVKGEILSAADIKVPNLDTSQAIRKTCADIGIIVYGMAVNSISVTGDRAAGTTGIFFSYLMTKNRLVANRPGLFSRFLFEITYNEVLIPQYPRFRIFKFKTMNKNNKEKELNLSSPINTKKFFNARTRFNLYAKKISNIKHANNTNKNNNSGGFMKEMNNNNNNNTWVTRFRRGPYYNPNIPIEPGRPNGNGNGNGNGSNNNQPPSPKKTRLETPSARARPINLGNAAQRLGNATRTARRNLKSASRKGK